MLDDVVSGVSGQIANMLLRYTERYGPGEGLSDEELLQRWAAEHKGRPGAMLEFARQMAPGQDPYVAAAEYERKMLRLEKRGGGG